MKTVLQTKKIKLTLFGCTLRNEKSKYQKKKKLLVARRGNLKSTQLAQDVRTTLYGRCMDVVTTSKC